MLFTSYFANWPKLHKEYPQLTPVSIALYPPKWGHKDVATFRELAPTSDILREWKEKHDEKLYTERFNHEVLSHLRKDEVIFSLIRITNPNVDWSMLAPDYNISKGVALALADAVLLCYEAPGKFCHRHIVADWLTRGGYRCEEFTVEYNPNSIYLNRDHPYKPDKLEKAEPCAWCGKATRNAEIWRHSGIVTPLCNCGCYDKYWDDINRRCNS